MICKDTYLPQTADDDDQCIAVLGPPPQTTRRIVICRTCLPRARPIQDTSYLGSLLTLQPLAHSTMKNMVHSMTMAACVGALFACDQASTKRSAAGSQSPFHTGYLRATYFLNDEPIVLQNDLPRRPIAQDSATVGRTWVQGSPVRGDLDGDGDEDVALVLMHDPGGSGTFSYLAVAVQIKGRHHGSNVVFLGDRISPPVITVREGAVSARFLVRRDDTPYAEPPTQVRVVEASLVGLHLKTSDPRADEAWPPVDGAAMGAPGRLKGLDEPPAKMD